MSHRDLLLYLYSYPEAAPEAAIDQSIGFAKTLSASLSALAVHVDLRTPGNWLADHLIGLGATAAAEERRSEDTARALLQRFQERAEAAGVFGESMLTHMPTHLIGPHVAGRARTRDLCLVPLEEGQQAQRSVAESVLFESGRPALVFRPGRAEFRGEGLGTVVIAWDGSAAAARALAESVPLLPFAREVRVLTVLNDKPGTARGHGDEAIRHLQTHGIQARADAIESGGQGIGEVLADYAAGARAGLLVMGAYGRSRMREFILGGATEWMLNAARVPVLLAH